jgi:hypothetical protein
VLAIAVPRFECLRSDSFVKLGRFWGFRQNEELALQAYMKVLHECSETEELEFIEWTISHGGSCRGSVGSDGEFTSLDISSVDSSSHSYHPSTMETMSNATARVTIEDGE